MPKWIFTFTTVAIRQVSYIQVLARKTYLNQDKTFKSKVIISGLLPIPQVLGLFCQFNIIVKVCGFLLEKEVQLMTSVYYLCR